MGRAVCGNGLTLALVLLVLAGCSSASPSEPDSGRLRDAMVLDSTLEPSDASPSDATLSDAGARDASTIIACGGSCDPRDGSACLEGERCDLVSAVPSCNAAGGELPAGAPCERPEDCASGLACFADAATGVGVCSRVCCPGDATCSVEERCGGSGELVTAERSAWGRCLPVRACELAHPEYACAEREGCYIVDSEGHTECLVAGTALEGEPCTVSNECAAGGVCTGITERTCARVCLIDMPRDCGADRRCEAQAYSPVGTGICTPSVH